MRMIMTCLLVAVAAGPLAGCGSGHGIEAGIPKNVQPPPDFDPGGGVKPDMSGKAAKAAPRP